MDASSPRLSIVIPTHDTRELTLACLASIFRSAVAGLEVLVVDDASQDGTAEAVRERFPTVLLQRHETAQRFTRAANGGLARARGEILLLLNSDTEIEQNGLVELLAVFAREPKLGIAGALLHYPDGSPQWSGGREPSLAWFFALASGLPALLGRSRLYRRLKPLAAPGPVAVDWVTGAAMALRRQVWEAAGPLDEGFRFYVQDLDFCLRARRAGWPAAVRPELRVLHHHGATIGQDPGASRRQQPELLWTDLLRWAAAAALRLGGRLRLASRLLASPFVAAERREEWKDDAKALRKALAAVSRRSRRLPSSP
jgi:N-acetylglucosaminyl-diphospho-decaprenol L-rhamnosyltransferase